jgi:hypothetical protein
VRLSSRYVDDVTCSSATRKRVRSGSDDAREAEGAPTVIPSATSSSQLTASVRSTPVTSEDAVRNVVFKDLHDRGYFLGPADVYGGDYSLYKGGGDPTKSHSVATVRVMTKGHTVRLYCSVCAGALLRWTGASLNSAYTMHRHKPRGSVADPLLLHLARYQPGSC